MSSIITTLLIATQVGIADAHPPIRHNHYGNHRQHIHNTHRGNNHRASRPLPPKRAIVSSQVYCHRGYWVMNHRRHGLMWRWNYNTAKWVVVLRF